MKKPFIYLPFLLIIVIVSCVSESGVIPSNEPQADGLLINDSDFIWVMQETNEIMQVINDMVTKGGIDHSLVESGIAERRLAVVYRMQVLKDRYKGQDIFELGQKAIKNADNGWWESIKRDKKGGISDRIETLDCGGACRSDLLSSCGAGCTWSATQCFDNGGSYITCNSSWNLCNGNCCSFYCPQ